MGKPLAAMMRTDDISSGASHPPPCDGVPRRMRADALFHERPGRLEGN